LFFNIDSDTGDAISGWLIMENVTETPEFVITVPDRSPITFRANVFRQDLVNYGFHATGMAGFQIDAQLVPDLAEQMDFTIAEVSSGFPIYRRFNSEKHINQKFLLIEVAPFPQFGILRAANQGFALRYAFLERHTLDTINAALTHNFSTSIFASGQLNWIRHGDYAKERGFVTAALLRDPFQELAERLLFARHLSRQESKNVHISWQKESYSELIKFVETTDLTNSRSLISAFRSLPPSLRRKLRSPMTSAFGCTPDEEVQRRHVSVALDNLAEFQIVGSRDHFNEFAVTADHYLSSPIFSDQELEQLPHTDRLATTLADVGVVADMLDEDIALYNFANEAVMAGLRSADVDDHA
jgi:hypothetical protein